MEFEYYDLIGTIGVLLIVGTYLLLQTGIVESKSFSYSLNNALGAALILVSLYFEFNWSAFLIEFFWLLISVVGLFRYFSGRRFTTPRAREPRARARRQHS